MGSKQFVNYFLNTELSPDNGSKLSKIFGKKWDKMGKFWSKNGTKWANCGPKMGPF